MSNEWKLFRKNGISEAREHVVGEDLAGVSVSDKDSECVKYPGGWIFRNPENHDDQWYVNETFMIENYVRVE